MDAMSKPQNDVAKQATHDRSVIDHLVRSFPSSEEEQRPRDPLRVRSAALYHQIRRSWTRAR